MRPLQKASSKDAFYGSVLINRQGKGFSPISMDKSYFIVPCDAKLKVTFNNALDELMIIAGQYNDQLKAFILN